jgi:hypothetical protein
VVPFTTRTSAATIIMQKNSRGTRGCFFRQQIENELN